MRHSRILKAGVACDQTEDHSNNLVADQDQQWLPATTGTVLGIALNHADLREQMTEAFNEKPHVNPPKTPVIKPLRPTFPQAGPAGSGCAPV